MPTENATRSDLPQEVRARSPKPKDPQSGRKLYIYQDIHFRLDQDEIQKLLMGTALYGDPGLCIRELLQNALDALELRELRLKMPKSRRRRHEPVDDLEGARNCALTLTWGGNPENGRVHSRYRLGRRHDQEGHPGVLHQGRQELLQERRLPSGAGGAGQRRSTPRRRSRSLGSASSLVS